MGNRRPSKITRLLLCWSSLRDTEAFLTWFSFSFPRFKLRRTSSFSHAYRSGIETATANMAERRAQGNRYPASPYPVNRKRQLTPLGWTDDQQTFPLSLRSSPVVTLCRRLTLFLPPFLGNVAALQNDLTKNLCRGKPRRREPEKAVTEAPASARNAL